MSEEQKAGTDTAALPLSTESDSLESPPEPTQRATGTMIADRLGETQEGAREQIRHIVWALGRTQSNALLEQTLQIEEQGGMLLPDGSRRRTPGGVFFHLAYTTGQPKPGKTLTRPTYQKRNTPPRDPKTNPPPTSPKPARPPAPAPASVPTRSPFAWEERRAAIAEISPEKGTVTTVKITFIGKAGKCVDKGTCVMTTMQSEKVPALPKGLPAPKEASTSYVVYISSKQWKAVAATVEDPEDRLIIEGYPHLDTETGTIAVFALSTTSKKLQMAKRQSQQPQPQE